MVLFIYVNWIIQLQPLALSISSCRQEVLLLDNEIAFNEAIIEEREQGIHEIQQQIGEVNEIFKDLAVLVHEQGTIIGEEFYLLFWIHFEILPFGSCCKVLKVNNLCYR